MERKVEFLVKTIYLLIESRNNILEKNKMQDNQIKKLQEKCDELSQQILVLNFKEGDK